MTKLYKILSFVLFFSYCSANFNPCLGKARFDEGCDIDDDCDGVGVACVDKKCACHEYYEEIADKKKIYCKKLPDKIDQDCTERCRSPMFCRSGKCKCVERGAAKMRGGVCVIEQRLGDLCESDMECTLPFSFCKKGKCSCISGTKHQGNACKAARHCPFGGTPGGPCVRYTMNQHVVNNQVNSGSKSDNCLFGQYCVTADGSYNGHCCSVTCPHKTPPEAFLSCEPNAPNPCPNKTHFCHRVSGSGFAFAACCRRPCRPNEAKAIYVKDECYARTSLGGSCVRHEQCDGFQTMQCYRGRCGCKPVYDPKVDSFSDLIGNPAQQCLKKCATHMGRGKTCYRKVKLDQKCVLQESCPENSACYRGKCVCTCAFLNDGYGNCKAPPPTQKTPEAEKPKLCVPKIEDALSTLTDTLKSGTLPPLSLKCEE